MKFVEREFKNNEYIGEREDTEYCITNEHFRTPK